MEIRPRTIHYYVTRDGRVAFREWYSKLADMDAKVVIRTRLTRVERGLLGDFKPIGDGVFELRLFMGPGYQVYLGMKDRVMVILLCGGDKGRQNKNIRTAKKYWEDYLRRSQHENTEL